MSKQANKTAIGVFVVGAVALAITAIVVFGSGRFLIEKETYVGYFDGSVKGLRVGAPVVFRGVQIGEVTDILIHADRHDMTVDIPVIMQFEPDKFRGIGKRIVDRRVFFQNLVDRGLKAQLQTQSLLTGQLMINFDFHPDKPVRLKGQQGVDLGKDVVEVPTIQTPLQKIEKTIEEIPLGELAHSIRNSLAGIEQMVNSPEIPQSLRYLRQTLKDFRNLVRHIDEKIDPLFVDVEQTLKNVNTLMQSIGTQIDPLAASVTRTSDTARETLGDARKLVNNINSRVQPLEAELGKTAESLRVALKQAEAALGSVDEMVSENTEFRYQLDIFLRELTMAARSVRTLADFLERHPDALLRGKGSTGMEGR